MVCPVISPGRPCSAAQAGPARPQRAGRKAPPTPFAGVAVLAMIGSQNKLRQACAAGRYLPAMELQGRDTAVLARAPVMQSQAWAFGFMRQPVEAGNPAGARVREQLQVLPGDGLAQPITGDRVVSFSSSWTALGRWNAAISGHHQFAGQISSVVLGDVTSGAKSVLSLDGLRQNLVTSSRVRIQHEFGSHQAPPRRRQYRWLPRSPRYRVRPLFVDFVTWSISGLMAPVQSGKLRLVPGSVILEKRPAKPGWRRVALPKTAT